MHSLLCCFSSAFIDCILAVHRIIIKFSLKFCFSETVFIDFTPKLNYREFNLASAITWVDPLSFYEVLTSSSCAACFSKCVVVNASQGFTQCAHMRKSRIFSPFAQIISNHARTLRIKIRFRAIFSMRCANNYLNHKLFYGIYR